jgi:hypothetical protein
LFGSEAGKPATGKPNELIALINQADTLRLLAAFNRITGRVRGAIVSLAEAYANANAMQR